ncbi:MAG TPA: DUF4157 domain-containing protein [Actinomycetota bacterium]|jgi:hypothetical protein
MLTREERRRPEPGSLQRNQRAADTPVRSVGYDDAKNENEARRHTWSLSTLPIHAPQRPEPRASGAPLPATVAADMGRAFDADFSRVRFREASLPRGVVASNRGDEIAFGRGMPLPGVELAAPSLAHELAHVMQRRNGAVESAGSAAEHEARSAATEVMKGGRPRITVGAPASRTLHSKLSDQLDAAAAAGKGKIFDLLRANPSLGDADARASLKKIFAAGTDDLWLAETLLDNGPEALWTPTLVTERVRRATTNKWAAEPGDIAADLADPYGTKSPPRVRAFFFPGKTARRALIIGGVHGTEQQGAKTVEELRTVLRARSLAGNPPHFTTILIPTLIEQTHKGGTSAGARHVPGGMGRTAKGTLEKSRSIEPNRNFPLPGEDLAAAKARGASGATDPELVFRDASGAVRPAQDTAKTATANAQTGTSIRMIAETRILISLIERFQPERLASIHAHSLKTVVGDAPGIFVDPRGIDPATKAVTNQGQVDEDDRLAAAMAREGTKRWSKGGVTVPGLKGGQADPFVGNAPGKSGASVRYSSTSTPEGNSLGTWAPVPTVAGKAGATASRPGITTVTVEIPQWSSPAQTAAQREIIELHRDLLLEIFLGDPSAVTPAAGSKTP